MNKELTTEKGMILAIVLSGLVLLVSQYFLRPTSAPTATKTGAQKSAQPVKPEAVQKPEAPPPAKPLAVASAVQAEKEETIAVETDVYRVVFSNRGAVVRSWILKHYKDHAGKPLELVNQKALAKVPPPFALAFKSQTPPTDPNGALFTVQRSPDGLEISFEFSDGRALTKKSFHFEKSSYLVGVTSEVTQNGVLVPHSILWRGGFGDATVPNPAAVEHALYYDLPNAKLQVKQAKDAKDAPLGASGQFSFAGLEDSYFAAVFLPGEKPSIEQVTYSDNVPNEKGTDEARVGAGVGGEGANQFSLFVGPKDTDLLRRVNPKLEQLIDWGWFGVIAKPLFYALNWTSDHLTNNYGWAIVLVTIVINILLFPLKLTSMKSSKKMQAIQPKIQAINDRYKSIPMRDPRQNEKNQEIMDLYKKEGINPVGGCLPLLIQMPFLYAFYKVLSVSIEMRGASWLWVSDLSQPESLAIHILPLLLVGTQFYMQKMTPSPGMDPTQQKMMMIMPLLFGYMFYFASAGLVLYWLTGNVVGIAQQLLLNRFMPAPAVAPAKAAPSKKK
jgi:YidC/Oxa1 family membrane protein insertase